MDLSDRLARNEPIYPPIQPGGECRQANALRQPFFFSLSSSPFSIYFSVWRMIWLAFVPHIVWQSLVLIYVRVSELGTPYMTVNQDFILGDPANGYDSYMGGMSLGRRWLAICCLVTQPLRLASVHPRDWPIADRSTLLDLLWLPARPGSAFVDGGSRWSGGLYGRAVGVTSILAADPMDVRP